MKELSIEEKAKAYDEVMDKAKKELDACSSQDCDAARQVFRLFPELKESEDERIRKALINVFATHKDYEIFFGVSVENIVAWLKKQGEKFTCEGTFVNVNDVREEFMQKVYRILDVDSTNNRANQIIDAFDSLPTIVIEKQGEPKLADNVEPKFHEGDWVVSPNGVYWHIDKISNSRYEVTSNTGESSNWPLDTNIYHKFNIQDAKDGDVLVTKNKNIFIFKSISGCTIYDYCGLYFERFANSSGTVNGKVAKQLPTDYVPATKEQRDFLFQKMHEAGYEWNAEKKDLKKIEQKPAWSKEDERMYRGLHNLIYSTPYCDSRKELSDFLNSLKNRLQSNLQQEWSEEDKKHLNRAINILDASKAYTKSSDKYEDTINWLKSLRPQSHWKPSKEQIEIIDMVLTNESMDDNVASILQELKEQLKAL